MRSLLVLLVMCGTVAAEATKRPSADVLVQRLGEARFHEREAAVKALIQSGTDAIPALKAAIATSADPEVRQRAEGVLQRLERIAESERFQTPKLVKLNYQSMPLGAAVADFKKQTDLNLILDAAKTADLTRPVTLQLTEVPVWLALEQFCAAARLHEDYRAEYLRPTNNTSAGNSGRIISPVFVDGVGMDLRNLQPYTPLTSPIVLVDGVGESVPGNRASAVRVLAMPGRFPANRIVRGAGRVIVNLDVAPSGLNWTGATSVRVLRAEDEDGRPVFADSKLESPFIDANGYSPWQFNRFAMMNDISGLPSSFGPKVPNPRLVPVSLRTEDRNIQMLRTFEGVVLGELAQLNTPLISISAIDRVKGSAGEHLGTKVIVADYTTNADGTVVLKIRGEMPNANNFAPMRVNNRPWVVGSEVNIGTLQNQLKYYDEAGVECARPSVASMTWGNGWNQPQTADMTLRFAKSSKHGPPTKIVYLGTKLVPLEVPFQLQNVRLP